MKPTRQRNASNETSRFMEDLQEALKTRKKNARYFAELKLEAYEEAEELPSGLRIMKTKTTDGDFGKMRKPLSVRYVGYLGNGRIFDSGVFSFNLGRGEVIEACDIAFKQLRVGEEATLFCPSAIAYGRRGAGKDIKPYTTLIFDVTLESVSE
jgi:FKBP-type peptidyl-prolyl cis-trans isomerase